MRIWILVGKPSFVGLKASKFNPAELRSHRSSNRAM